MFTLAAYALQDFLKSRKLWETFRTGFQDMAAALCVRNLSKMKSERAYLYLLEKLRNDILPHLEIGIGRPDGRLESAIRDKEKIIVYGAGMLASVFVRMLIMKYGYERGQMLIAVSSRRNNASKLYGVRVQEMHEIPDGEKGCLTVIAISAETIQREVETTLQAERFFNLLRLGFKEMLGLIEYGVRIENAEVG